LRKGSKPVENKKKSFLKTKIHEIMSIFFRDILALACIIVVLEVIEAVMEAS
jgi:hypothetical protein